MNSRLLIEAVAVGILLVPLGYLVLYGSVELSKRYKSVNRMDKNIKMSLGFFIHIYSVSSQVLINGIVRRV